MQNTEIYRRGIVFPLNSAAVQALFNNEVDSETPVKYLAFPDDELFYSLWDKGLFQQINDQVGTMLDDYEEEIIVPDQIPLLTDTLHVFIKKHYLNLGIEEKVSLTGILSLCKSAQIQNTPLFFFL